MNILESIVNNIEKTRQLVAQQLNLPHFDKNTWVLLGTLGCHLCDTAEEMLNQFSTVYPIQFIKVDITDLHEDLMSEFTDIIPVILLPNCVISYPFSVADLSHYNG